MPFCSNPRCPHLKDAGRPAELEEGVELCPDCGSKVQPVERKSLFQVGAGLPSMPQPLRRRIKVTLGILFAWWLCTNIPSPFILWDAHTHDGVRVNSGLYGPFSVGITPFFFSFLVVELYALIFARTRRHRDPELRRKMWLWACSLGAVFALTNGWGQSIWLESVHNHMFHEPLLTMSPGIGFKLMNSITLAAGSVCCLFAANFLTRFGVGNGFLALMIAGIATSLPSRLSTLYFQTVEGSISPVGLLLIILSIGFLLFGMGWFMTHFGKARMNLPVRLPTCGSLPLSFSVAVIMTPNSLANLLDPAVAQGLMIYIQPGEVPTLILQLVVIGICVPVASSLFYLRRRDLLGAEEHRPEWLRSQLVSGGFLAAIAFAVFLAAKWFPSWGVIVPRSFELLMIVAIVFDFRDEVLARWRAPGGLDLIPVESHQDMADALDALEDVGEEEGAVLQGLHFRSLTYFFDPYVPLTILAANQEADDAP